MEENPKDSKHVNRRMKEESVEMAVRNTAFFSSKQEKNKAIQWRNNKSQYI